MHDIVIYRFSCRPFTFCFFNLVIFCVFDFDLLLAVSLDTNIQCGRSIESLIDCCCFSSKRTNSVYKPGLPAATMRLSIIS